MTKLKQVAVSLSITMGAWSSMNMVSAQCTCASVFSTIPTGPTCHGGQGSVEIHYLADDTCQSWIRLLDSTEVGVLAESYTGHLSAVLPPGSYFAWYTVWNSCEGYWQGYSSLPFSILNPECMAIESPIAVTAAHYGCSDGRIDVFPIIRQPASCTDLNSYSVVYLHGVTNPGFVVQLWPTWGDTAHITGLAPGDYQVLISEYGGWFGCYEESSLTVAEAPCALSGQVSHTDATSAACSDGSITVAVTSAVSCVYWYLSLLKDGGEQTYIGSIGDYTYTINDLLPGAYTVKLSFSGGATTCEQYYPVTVGSPGCVVPFTLAGQDATAAGWCGDGAVLVSNMDEACNWLLSVHAIDSTLLYGPFSTYYWGSNNSVTNLAASSYLVRCTKDYYDPFADEAYTCTAWAAVEINCTGNVQLTARAFLEGSYVSGTGLMNDALRGLGTFPITEPYSALGYTHIGGGGGEVIAPAILNTTGPDAVVDWVLLELRSPAVAASIVASRSALLQRDGDIVDVDGSSPVAFPITAGSYHVAIRHRNHLGVMTASPIVLGPTPTTVDLTSSGTPAYGSNARKTVGSSMALWAGNVTFNNSIQYTGSGNDRDKILIRVGSTTPNNTVSGYYPEDVNLNGAVRYTGAGNDRDPILVNVGSTTPNSVRLEQLP